MYLSKTDLNDLKELKEIIGRIEDVPNFTDSEMASLVSVFGKLSSLIYRDEVEREKSNAKVSKIISERRKVNKDYARRKNDID